MMKGYDNWHSKKGEVLQLYLHGMDPRHIAGITGVPKIRVEHEMEKAAESNPDLLRRHMAARYPKRRSALRYPGAVILTDRRQ